MAAEKISDKKAPEKAPEQDLGVRIRLEVAQALNGVLNQIQSRATGLDQLGAAYIKAVSQSRDAHKNATNPHLRNQYADLGSVLNAVREGFLSNGLWLNQSPGEIVIKQDGNPYIQLRGVLIHTSGQSISYLMELPAYSKSKSGETILNPQTAGGAISYARRYMWAAVAGITQTDDDAAEASYIDTAAGPASESGAAPQSPADDGKAKAAAAMLEAIAATKSLDDLKLLRDPANALKVKEVTAAYLARRESFLNTPAS